MLKASCTMVRTSVMHDLYVYYWLFNSNSKYSIRLCWTCLGGGGGVGGINRTESVTIVCFEQVSKIN